MSHEDVSKIPIDRIIKAQHETSHRIQVLVQQRLLEEDSEEVEEVDFTELIVDFIRSGEIDLEFTTENDIMELLAKFNNAKSKNIDKQDPAYQDIYKRYKQMLKLFKQEADTTEKVQTFMVRIKDLTLEIEVLNQNNNSLVNRYCGYEE